MDINNDTLVRIAGELSTRKLIDIWQTDVLPLELFVMLSRYFKDKSCNEALPNERIMLIYGVIETNRVFPWSLLLHLLKDPSLIKVSCVQELLMPGTGHFPDGTGPARRPLNYVKKLSKDQGVDFETMVNTASFRTLQRLQGLVW